MKATATRPPAAPSRTEEARARIGAAARVPGHPLAPAARAALEARFAHDLGDIRIHTDDAAAAAARALDAHAFALGRDVFFARGAYRPGTADGDALLEHEIAHALAAPHAPHAASAAPTRTPGETAPSELAAAASTPGDAVERNAEATVAALRAGRTPVVAAVRESDVRFARAAAGLVLRPADAADPAQLIETLVQTVLRALRADAEDRSGRLRGELSRLDERTRRLVFDALQSRLVAADWTHLIDVLSRPLPEATEQGTRPDDVPERAPAGETAPAPETAAAQSASAQAATADGAVAESAPAQSAATDTASAQTAQAPASGAVDTEPAARNDDVVRPPLTGGETRSAAGGAPEAATPAPAAAEGSAAREAAALPDTSVPGGDQPEAASATAGAGAAEVTSAPEAASAAGATPSADAAAAPDTATTVEAESVPGTATTAGAETAPETATADEAETAPGATAAEAATEPSAPDSAASDSTAAAEPIAAEPVAAAPLAAEPLIEPAPAETAAAPEPAAAPAAAAAEPVASAPQASGATAPAVDLGPEPSAGDDDAIGHLGGGGGGSALPDPPRRDEPAPAQAAPAATLAAVGVGTPAAIARGLSSVQAAVGRAAQHGRSLLADAPPSLERPSGAPRGLTRREPSPPAALPTSANLPAAPSANATPVAAPAAPPALAAPLPQVAAPAVTADAQGQVTAADVQRIAQSVDALPTSDPALAATAGAAPTVALEGDADPAQADAQQAALAHATADAARAGAADAAAPLGEDGIAPTVAAETLQAELPGAGSDEGGAAAGGGEGAQLDPADPAAIVAEARDGDAVRGAAQAGSQNLAAQDEQTTQTMSAARADAARESDAGIEQSAQQQSAERSSAQAEVQRQRGAWTAAQRTAADEAQQGGEAEVGAARRAVGEQRVRGESEARGRIDEGNQRIAGARGDAERQARAQRDRAREESARGGFFSRLASSVGAFFDGVRAAIQSAFEAARRAVRDAVQWAQRAAAEAVARARSAIVERLRAAAERIGGLADTLLAAFPAARERFRGLIRRAVEAALAAVDRLAGALRATLQRVLNELGRALLAAFALAARAARELVAGVLAAVQGAIRAAQSYIATVGAFAALIRDVARNPGQWVRNLGAAIVDGLRNHLWTALKAAVKEWFNGKVEQVVGVGRMIFDVLRRGGIPFRRIGAMVWAAVKAAIPRAIAEFLIQRLVAMLVPAVAAIMAIVEGLQAAWATVSRIIAAFERFMAFLRAVKDGNAGPLFARALAAAAVAVIDFTANFIIAKIARGARGVGARLRGIADRLMAWLRRGAAAVRRGFQRVRRAVVAAARWVGRQAGRAGRWLGRQARRAGRWLANTRVGRFIGRQYARARAALRRRLRPETEAQKIARRDRAVAAIRPRLQGLLRRGVSGLRLRATLAMWRIAYRLRVLALSGERIVAGNSPTIDVESIFTARSSEILRIVHEAAMKLLDHDRVRTGQIAITGQRTRAAAESQSQRDAARRARDAAEAREEQAKQAARQATTERRRAAAERKLLARTGRERVAAERKRRPVEPERVAAERARAGDQLRAHDTANEAVQKRRLEERAAHLAEARRLRNSSALDYQPPTITAGAGPGYLADARALRESPRPVDWSAWELGSHQPMRGMGEPYHERQFRQGPGGTYIGAQDATVKTAEQFTYNALLQHHLEPLRARAGLTEHEFAARVQDYIRTGRVGPELARHQGGYALQEFSRLIGAVETSRRSSNVVFTTLLLEEVRGGTATMAEAFSNTSAINPMSMEGAAGAHRAIEADITGTKATSRGSVDEIATARRREIALVARFVEREIAGLHFASHDEFMKWVHDHLPGLLEARARSLFNLSHRPGSVSWERN